MAKSRVSINPLYTGGAGGYSFYVRSGEQVVRQRRNNSNYGETASRSYAQMIRRIMWGNLVNIYKQIKSWQQKAYDSKSVGVTDYNMFMKLNINNATCGTTKQANQQGMAVWENYQVSNGSLPSINYTLNTTDHLYVTDLNFTQAITSAMTVGELAAELIARNPRFKAGDNIAFIFCKNHQYIAIDFPVAYSEYYEITLDVASTKPLSDVAVIGAKLTKDSNNKLCVTYPADEGSIGPVIQGIAIIHTRKVSGALQVSSQSVLMTSDHFTQRYSGETWYQHCIESYGLDTEVPLDPNFKNDIITKVTANGVMIENAASLTGSQSVRVWGNQLYGSGYTFVHNGVEYVPMSSTDEYDEFVLTDNGTYTISVDGKKYMSFAVRGIVVPSNLSGSIGAALANSRGENYNDSWLAEGDKCLNYPQTVSEDYPYFNVYVYVNDATGVEQTDFTVNNGSIVAFTPRTDANVVIVRIQPTDDDQKCYMEYDDFIVFVGNYPG